MKVTLKVIAEETGVSQMTVSRILRGKVPGLVSDKLRKKVVAALEKNGYDFQKPARRTQKARLLREPVIHFVISRSDYLERPPRGETSLFVHVLQEYAQTAKVRLNYVVGLHENNPKEPAWDNLNVIRDGDPVLFHSTYQLTTAIALQNRGCRVAIIDRDLFWRNYYAPQLKNMARFIIRTANGTAQAVRYLMNSGCRKVACAANSFSLNEPNYPVLSGYDYVLRLHGSTYRHVIPLSRTDSRCDQVSCIREAWRRKKFDGLFLPEMALPGRGELPIRTIHEYLGLPYSVRIAVVDGDEETATADATVVLHYPYRELMPDLFDTLFAKDFSCVEKLYECRMETSDAPHPEKSKSQPDEKSH